MDFEKRVAELVAALTECVAGVYHLQPEAARLSLERSNFYRLLMDRKQPFWRDDAETNFQRYQNEIEYGAWNRNENGGIVE